MKAEVIFHKNDNTRKTCSDYCRKSKTNWNKLILLNTETMDLKQTFLTVKINRGTNSFQAHICPYMCVSTVYGTL